MATSFKMTPLGQAVRNADPLVEHEALPLECAVAARLGQVAEDPAVQLADVLEALLDQVSGCLFAADSAGTEQRKPAALARVELTVHEVLELPNVAVFAHFAPRNVPMSDS